MTFEKRGKQQSTDTTGSNVDVEVNYENSSRRQVVRRLASVYGIQFEDLDNTPVGVRFSGHPDALLAMFRALHIAYAERRVGFRKSEEPRKRTIILDKEGGEPELNRNKPNKEARLAHDILPTMRKRRK